MALGTDSGCINHPGIEAVIRCKQCGRPACSTCRVKGPTGDFCSEECKEKHQSFIQKAQQVEAMKKVRRGFPFGRLIAKFITWAILLIFLVAVAAVFGIEIPYLSPLVRSFIPFLPAPK